VNANVRFRLGKQYLCWRFIHQRRMETIFIPIAWKSRRSAINQDSSHFNNLDSVTVIFHLRTRLSHCAARKTSRESPGRTVISAAVSGPSNNHVRTQFYGPSCWQDSQLNFYRSRCFVPTAAESLFRRIG